MSHSDWFQAYKAAEQFLIAGPCSAETYEQVMETGLALSQQSVDFFRAGVWKPRTRPGGFEGVGEVALPWLAELKKQTGLKIAIEVASPAHIEAAEKFDIDMYWIGARTTANPFAVQELANALHGSTKIVLLKNPVNPDLSLWIGGYERLQNADIQSLGVIHRGFSTYPKSKYRNSPEWQIAIDFRQELPDVPMICDPSHMAGKREYLAELTDIALNLNYDGFMIESHPNPDEAWSDAAQQLTPAALDSFMRNRKRAVAETTNTEYLEAIRLWRSQIDVTDAHLLELLGKRMAISEKIGILKKNYGISVLQNDRWMKVLEHMQSQGQENNLSDSFIRIFFKAIHEESIRKQVNAKSEDLS